MKVKVKTEIERDGVIYNEGDVIDIPENNVPVWVAKGWGEAVKTKEEKPFAKETKEFKGKKESK
tara:strand:+ start:602 stop:793 length:192 start_codon:yes stop_codon:yes gene_type:complete